METKNKSIITKGLLRVLLDDIAEARTPEARRFLKETSDLFDEFINETGRFERQERLK